MIGTVDLQDAVSGYLDLAAVGHAAAAVRLALGLLDQGATSEAVIVDLLSAAQCETGERWLRNEWTVADEHLVSGVTQRALDAVANTIDQPSYAPSVVVACAEGDWHSLPAQMGAELLRARGIVVSFLGASTPADHVARLLSRDKPDAMMITCNLPLFFAGVIRLTDAAHRAGVPVMAGGRSVPSLQRALSLGADSWAPDISSAALQIPDLRCPPSPNPNPGRPNSAALLLDVDSARLASQAFDSLIAAHPFMCSFNDDQLTRTKEDLAFIVRFVAAAAIVGDSTVLTEFLGWLKSLLIARSVPPGAILAGLEVLVPLITNVDGAAGQLALHAAEHLSAAPR